MGRKSVLMLSNTGRQWEVTGAKVRADSYWGHTDGIHTISVHYYNFIGGFKLQGTLSLEPTETDWFDITLNAYSCNSGSQSYLEYPKDSTNPTSNETGGDTGVDAFTFVGNYTFLRVKLVRDYLGDTPTNNIQLDQFGLIDRVLLSL